MASYSTHTAPMHTHTHTQADKRDDAVWSGEDNSGKHRVAPPFPGRRKEEEDEEVEEEKKWSRTPGGCFNRLPSTGRGQGRQISLSGHGDCQPVWKITSMDIVENVLLSCQLKKEQSKVTTKHFCDVSLFVGMTLKSKIWNAAFFAFTNSNC